MLLLQKEAEIVQKVKNVLLYCGLLPLLRQPVSMGCCNVLCKSVMSQANSVTWGGTFWFFATNPLQFGGFLFILIFMQKFCLLPEGTLTSHGNHLSVPLQGYLPPCEALLAQGTFVTEVECVGAHKKAKGVKI